MSGGEGLHEPTRTAACWDTSWKHKIACLNQHWWCGFPKRECSSPSEGEASGGDVELPAAVSRGRAKADLRSGVCSLPTWVVSVDERFFRGRGAVDELETESWGHPESCFQREVPTLLSWKDCTVWRGKAFWFSEQNSVHNFQSSCLTCQISPLPPYYL